MNIVESFKNTFDLIRTTRTFLRGLELSADTSKELPFVWGQYVLSKLQVQAEVLGEVCTDPSMLFVGNHISYFDIPFLLSAAPKVNFVAKSEVAAWPVFGKAAQRLDTIFVKREKGSSRRQARKAVIKAIASGKRTVLFPSGTTCLHENKSWRHGAFEIAKQTGCLVQPFRISYSPLRAVAYVNRDFFPWHLFQLFRLGGFKATIEFHPPVYIKDPIQESLYWQYWAQGLIETRPVEKRRFSLDSALNSALEPALDPA